jgi:hypothetical protein
VTLFISSRHALVKLGFLWLLIVAFQSCEVSPEVRVQATYPPTFTFSRGTLVDMLLVYHLRPEQAVKGIYLDEILEDKTNISWIVEGKHDSQVPIAYGSVPNGMHESVLAKPLIEGDYYMVLVASGVSARFVIRNGNAEQIK